MSGLELVLEVCYSQGIHFENSGENVLIWTPTVVANLAPLLPF